MTVKGCMPFLDALTAGYILKMPQDLAIKHNVDGENGEKVIAQLSAAAMEPLYAHLKGCNLNINNLESHPPKQLGECPYHEQNKNMAYHKILKQGVELSSTSTSKSLENILRKEKFIRSTLIQVLINIL